MSKWYKLNKDMSINTEPSYIDCDTCKKYIKDAKYYKLSINNTNKVRHCCSNKCLSEYIEKELEDVQSENEFTIKKVIK